VLLAADAGWFRQGLSLLLSERAGFSVTEVDLDAGQLASVLDCGAAQVVILCLLSGLPGERAAAVLEVLKARPGVPGETLAVLDRRDRVLVCQAAEAGVGAYVLTSVGADVLAEAVRRLAGRESLGPGSIGCGWRLVEIAPKLRGLGRRQVQVVYMASLGLSNAEIGRVLGLSKESVAKAWSQVYKAVGVRRRSAVVGLAVREGLAPPAVCRAKCQAV
jgi:DNA-binding NarL/FixJ family response regulator